VTRRASTEPRDSRVDGGEREAEARFRGRGAARREGEVGSGERRGGGGGPRSVSKQSGHLVELSREPTVEQRGTVMRKRGQMC